MTLTVLAQAGVRTYERFEWAGMPGGMAALGATALAAGLAAAVVLLYRRERAAGHARLRWAACALRLLALAALGGILMDPSVAHDVERDVPGRVVVLVDTSASMSVRDAQLPQELARGWADALGLPAPQAVAELSRAQIAAGALGHLLPRLAAANQVDVMTFAREAEPLLSVARGSEPSVPVPLPPATGAFTDLAGALQAALDAGPDAQPLAGVVVLTDGRDTSGGDLAAAAEEARRRGVPVYFIGIGSPAMPRDVAVTALTAADRAIVGLPLQVQAFVRADGYEAEEAVIVLDATERGTGRRREVLRRVITLAGDGRRQPVDLTHTPESAGEFTYEARVEPLAGEFRTDNNAATAEVVVADEKIGVLVVAGGPSYDYRFLKALLERDPTFAVTSWLHGSAAPPHAREDLLAYDLVLLIDVSPEDITGEWPGVLTELVDSEGLGIVFLAGPTYTPALLADAGALPGNLLPVTADASRTRAMIGAPGYHTQSRPVSVDPTGAAHPILGPPAGTDRAAYWQGLPSLYWVLPVESAKPGATVLLRCGEPGPPRRSGEAMPLVAVQPYGLGRVLYCGSPGTWRWRRAGIERYERFWLQAFRYCAGGRLRGGDRRAALMLDRAEFSVGEPVRVRARLLDDALRPLGDEAVVLGIERNGDPMGTIRAGRVPGEEGIFEGVFYPQAFGRFAVVYVAPDGMRFSESFHVRPPQVEFENLRLARPAMERIAETTGGRYVLPGGLSALADSIPDLSRTVVESGPLRPAWDRFHVLILLIGALAAEWVLRKSMGML